MAQVYDRECSQDDCARPVLSRGWCGMHYQRWRKWGDPTKGRASAKAYRDIVCCDCGISFPSRASNQKRCEQCLPEYQSRLKREYVERNSEKVREWHRAKRTADPEKYRQQKREYNRRNKEQLREYHKTWREKNAEKLRWQRRVREYGISRDQFDKMLADHDGRCAVCHVEVHDDFEFHVDHCHETGTVRGILCPPCNKGLGHFSDDAERIRRAADYLDSQGFPAPTSAPDEEVARRPSHLRPAPLDSSDAG